jgi:hypothetical protein
MLACPNCRVVWNPTAGVVVGATLICSAGHGHAQPHEPPPPPLGGKDEPGQGEPVSHPSQIFRWA